MPAPTANRRLCLCPAHSSGEVNSRYCVAEALASAAFLAAANRPSDGSGPARGSLGSRGDDAMPRRRYASLPRISISVRSAEPFRRGQPHVSAASEHALRDSSCRPGVFAQHHGRAAGANRLPHNVSYWATSSAGGNTGRSSPQPIQAAEDRTHVSQGQDGPEHPARVGHVRLGPSQPTDNVHHELQHGRAGA